MIAFLSGLLMLGGFGAAVVMLFRFLRRTPELVAAGFVISGVMSSELTMDDHGSRHYRGHR